MTKKDAVNLVLMAPFLLAMIGGFLYSMVTLMTKQPLGLVTLAIITAFIVGFIRYIDI